ncbi:MAG: serine/threonine protein kinase [Paracoccaceae bacterium]|jgi:serine/threonine protein kinase
MELAFCSLSDELQVDQTLGGGAKRALFDILSGLQAIHAKGYKLRDLKPQNVLKLSNPDGTHRYAISDFGFRISDFGLMTPAAGQTTTLTATNAGGGTPLYCAPKCTTNLRRATHLADIY